MDIFRDSPLYKELTMDLDQARAEGRESALLILQRFLTFRFQTPAQQYTDRLQHLDLATIRQLSNLLVDVATLAEFEAALNQLAPRQH